MQPSCPGSRDLTGTGKGLSSGKISPLVFSGVPRNFFRRGVQQIQLTEGRENRDLGGGE
jgi:hypothetical protein